MSNQTVIKISPLPANTTLVSGPMALAAHDADPDAHPAIQADVDGKVSKTGDTMSGNLTLTGTNRRIVFDPGAGNVNPGVNFKDSAGTNRSILFYETGAQEVRFTQYSAAGASLGNALTISSVDGTVTASKALTVGSPTAVGHAPRTTAVDALTGRYAVNGIELGHTGWRDLSSLLHTAWQGASSYVAARRQGDQVHWRINLVPTTVGTDPTEFPLVIPTGFREQSNSPNIGAFDHLGYTEGDSTGGTLVRPVIVRVHSSELRVVLGSRAPDGFGFIRANFTTYTPDAWFTTLPGAQQTPPFVLPA